MKSNPLNAFLVGVLFIFSVCAAGLATWYFISVRTIHKMQPELVEINNVRARVQMLVGEVMEYRKHNPTIDPILQSVNLISRTSQPVPPAPKVVPK